MRREGTFFMLQADISMVFSMNLPALAPVAATQPDADDFSQQILA